MKRFQSRSANSASMFPFLAVLVCAMGALIFLLLVTTQRIRSDAVAKVIRERAELSADPRARLEDDLDDQALHVSETPLQLPDEPSTRTHPELEPLPQRLNPIVVAQPSDPPKSPLPKPRPTELQPLKPIVAVPVPPKRDRAAELRKLTAKLHAEWQAKVATLEVQRRAQQEILEQKNRQLAATARGVRDAESKADGLQARLDGLSARVAQDEQTLASLSQEDALLVERLSDAGTRLRSAEFIHAQQQSEHVFVPFDGQNGTTRRPIFIECTDRTIRFVAEGVELSPADVNGFTTEYNPILAGALALVGYHKARAKSADAHEEPYVLLIVRPEGSVAFYAVRQMLSPLKQSYGYELVEKDFSLRVPPSTPEAARLCREAVQRVLEQQELVAKRSRHHFPGSDGPVRLRTGGGKFDFLDDDDEGAGSGVTASTGLIGPKTTASDSFFSSRDYSRRNRQPTSTESSDDRNVSSGGPRGRADGAGRDRTDLAGRTGTRAGSDSERREGGASSRAISGSGDRPAVTDAVRRDSTSSGGTREQGGARGSGQAGVPTALSRWQAALAARRAAQQGASGSESHTQQSAPGMQLPAASRQQGQQPQSLANRRWGLSEPGATIGFERDLEIEVLSDRLVVGARTVATRVGLNKDVLMQQVVLAIDIQAREWGRPPANFYWIPALIFNVHPGGDANYERVATRLRDRGLDSSVQHRRRSAGLESPRE